MNKFVEVLHAVCLEFYERFYERARVQVWMKTAISIERLVFLGARAFVEKSSCGFLEFLPAADFLPMTHAHMFTLFVANVQKSIRDISKLQR